MVDLRGGMPSRLLMLIVAAAMLAQTGCGFLSAPRGSGDGPGAPIAIEEIEDATPRAEPYSKYGNPDSYVVLGKRYYTLKSAKGFAEQGIASWYGSAFHGRRTSSGEPYDMYQMTAAHKQLPLPTYVQVRNLDNGRTATVKVNDRGPFHDNRVIDLSYAAALKLGVVSKGTAFVEVRALDASGVPGAVIAQTETRSRAEPSPDPANSGIYIQVGAFQDRNNALRLSQEIGRVISDDGVHIQELMSNGTRYYRVQIGPLDDVSRADEVAHSLVNIGVRQHTFVTR
jgi:rare lipoprotein A